MKAGASKRDITVPELLKNVNIHDPLFARVLVLDDGDKSVAIACLDMDRKFFPEVNEKVAKELGIEFMLVNCSHTHSWHGSWRRGGPEWRERVGALIYEAVEEAQANMVPVSLHTGRTRVQIGHNRYGDAFTQSVAPWVNVLEARGEDGKPVAVLFEHATHPVMTTGTEMISADFPAYAIKRINEELGDEVMAIFAQGCCGNINSEFVGAWVEWGEGDPFEGTEKSGRELGDAVLVAMHKSTEIEADKFALGSKNVMLPCQLPSMELWEETIRRIKTDISRENWPNDAAMMKRMEVLKGFMEQGKRPEVPIEINAVMLGSEWGLVTMSGEVFSEYELWVNAFAPFKHTMVFAYTNGFVSPTDNDYGSHVDTEYIGYVPTDRALAMGIKTPIVAETACMEAGSFPGFFHGVGVDGAYTCFSVGIEDIVKDGIASLWTK